MSDTVINRPSGKAKMEKGLSMERIYTTSGQHPYENVKWERRDVVQSNWKSGEDVFSVCHFHILRKNRATHNYFDIISF